MRRSDNGPILIRRIQVWWYPLALVPILAFGWLAVTGLVPTIVAPIALFALIFWVTSLVFAIVGKLRGPRPERRS